MSPTGYRSPSSLDGFPSAPPSPVGPPSPAGNNGFYMSPQTQQMQKQFEQFSVGMCPGGAPATQQTMLGSAGPSQRTTPQTPTNSIPEITLSDFSSSSSAAFQLQELPRDLRDASDLLQGHEDDFREAEALGELDLDGLHMLTNQEEEVIDPSAEHCFRMESLGQ
ncbi:uncharacterized protein LOC119100835 isoform X2 [Pollicipes pollicipes]|uniref:uncharacterized protein LOC119100835 isoform X2 n=1 Tax=Pollicipes pollicipes TaxID=41117 RepID=UPI001885108A|nr:uncharacterized protein LOC119100835 isoform X2 [Pollicipes pollicipes]